MGRIIPTSVLSHWNHHESGLQQSAAEFYGEVERRLGAEGISDIKMERVKLSEGGLLSANREYLQVRRGDHVFHVCAAPFGSGFFVSWWLGETESGFWAWLAGLPYVGGFFGFLRGVTKPLTYYKLDTGFMFQSVTHGAVTSALDELLEGKGMRALAETERKPVMRDFFAHLGGK
jgi:hypothetical protein